MSEESSIALDRFGRPIDPVLEEYKKRCINPRDMLDPKKGEICEAEMKVYEKMLKMRDGVIPYEGDENLNGHLIFMDSLVESAFDSAKDSVWSKY